MSVRDELIGTYNQTVGVKLDIDEAIVILPIWDVPLQRFVGEESTDQVKVEWLEEDLTPQAVTQVGAAVGGSSPWTITVDDVAVLRPGDILLQKDGSSHTLQFVVTSTDPNTDEAVVAAFGANTTAPATSGTLEIIGQYRDEGGDPEDPRSVERANKFNYTQIGQEAVEATRTARKRGLYGMSDPYDHEVMKKFKELAIRFERSMVNGVRTMSVDAKKRFMGGLFYYISSNTESGAKANVKTLVNSLLKKTYEKGGAPRTLMVSPAVKTVISEGYDANLRRAERTDRGGGYVVDHILTDFGEVDVVINRHFPKTKGILMQQEFIKRRTFDGYFHELLAKTGDADSGQLVGEYSLEVKNEQAHGILTVADA